MKKTYFGHERMSDISDRDDIDTNRFSYVSRSLEPQDPKNKPKTSKNVPACSKKTLKAKHLDICILLYILLFIILHYYTPFKRLTLIGAAAGPVGIFLANSAPRPPVARSWWDSSK